MQAIKKFSKNIIPYPFQFYLQKRRPSELHDYERQDLVSFIVNDKVRLDIYIKGPEVATSGVIELKDNKQAKNMKQGIGLIVNAVGEEIARFDCYEGAGHFHPVTISFSARSRTFLSFPEKTLLDQIDRAVFEITHNIDWYLQHHPIRKVRNIKVQKSHLRQVAKETKKKMQEYVNVITANPDTGLNPTCSASSPPSSRELNT